jgi:hypothetical protein
MPYPQQQNPMMPYGQQQMGQFGQPQQQQDPWSWWESFFGKPGGINQIGGIDELLQQGLQQYQNPYQGFEPIGNSIGNYFKSDILPHIQNQFNAQSGGHFSSGVLGSNVASGNASLADRLSAAQAQYGQNARNSALSAIQTAKPQYYQQGGQKGGFDYLMDILKLVASAVPGSSAGNSPGSAGPGGAPGGFSLPPLPRQPDFSDIYKRGASR